jgi:hypothetical protein
MDALPGEIAMEASGAGVTVRSEVAVNEPLTADIRLEPPASPVARPVLLMVEMFGAAELQVTWLVTSCTVPLLKVSRTWNCNWEP